MGLGLRNLLQNISVAMIRDSRLIKTIPMIPLYLSFNSIGELCKYSSTTQQKSRIYFLKIIRALEPSFIDEISLPRNRNANKDLLKQLVLQKILLMSPVFLISYQNVTNDSMPKSRGPTYVGYACPHVLLLCVYRGVASFGGAGGRL